MAERGRACAPLTVRGFDACVDSRLNKTDEYRERYTAVRRVLLSYQFRGRWFTRAISKGLSAIIDKRKEVSIVDLAINLLVTFFQIGF